MTRTDKPIYRIETVTPEKAARWLTQNTHNRDLTTGKKDEYAGAMARGEWTLGTDALAFEGDGTNGGRLWNGQHRLYAVVQSGVTIEMLVGFNIPQAAQETMDSGLKRSLGAKLKLRGESNYNVLAAALAVAWSYDVFGVDLGRQWPTHQQLLAYLGDHSEIRDALTDGSRLHRAFGAAVRSWPAWVYLFRREAGAEYASTFFDRLESGADLTEGDPVLLYRKFLDRWARAHRDRRLGRRVMTGTMIKAFNAACLGQELKQLDYKAGTEAFPKIITAGELGE